MVATRDYCADLCAAAGEPMLGTAPEVDVWLLLEYRPPWQSKALEENDLPPTTRAWLANVVDGFAAQGRKVRPQFIRQPEEAERSSITLYLASDGELRRFEGRDYEEVERLDLRSSALEPVSEAHYFVCTNGQRDLCCARYGLPTYARLRLFAGERAWQTTHLGGHRFAPNVLALPQGALYGRVFADEAARFASAVEDRRLSLPHLRGRSAYPPEAQAAEAKVENAGALLGAEGSVVTFATPNGERTVRVERLATPLEIIASCGKTETELVYPFIRAGTAFLASPGRSR